MMPALRRTVVVVLVAMAVASCTKVGTSIVPIDVLLDTGALPSATLRVRSTFASFAGHGSEERFTCTGGGCYPVVRIGLRLTADAQGAVSLTVERLDDGDRVVATGTATAQVVPGQVSAELTIPLTAVGPPITRDDAGDDAARDAAADSDAPRADATADTAGGDTPGGDVRPDATADSSDGGGIDRPADRPADLSTAGNDAADSAAVDTSPADACAPRAEDCFNGADDDCDGLVDCADSDCQPAATCVPTVTGRTLGAAVSAATCPARFANPQPILSGFHDVRSCNGCDCLGSTTCTVVVVKLGVNCTTQSTPPVRTVTQGDPCDSSTTIQTGSSINVIPHCEPASTTGQVAPPTWDQSASFCDGMPAGGGCTAGNVCLPRAPGASSAACYLIAGTDTSACAAPYSSRGVWYTGFSGSPTCTCGCGTPAGGDCAGARLITNAGLCPASGPLQGTAIPVPGSVCQGNSVAFQFQGTSTAPTCGVTGNVAGDARVPTGAQVLCCL